MNHEQTNALHSLVEAYVGAPDMRIMPAVFSGKLVPDDEWVYLQIDKGIPKSACDALHHMGIPCEPRYDNPHMTVIKKDEIAELKKLHGDGWKEAVLAGGDIYTFEILEMSDLDPDGWDEMDRVWFLRCSSPGLAAKRMALELTPLPTGEDGEPQDFHITVAVRSSNTDGVKESTRETIIGILTG